MRTLYGRGLLVLCFFLSISAAFSLAVEKLPWSAGQATGEPDTLKAADSKTVCAMPLIRPELEQPLIIKAMSNY